MLLAARLIVEEALEGEVRDKVGRERYERADGEAEASDGAKRSNSRPRYHADRNWIGGPEDPGSLTEIRKALEAAVLIYTANCGPLDTSNAAWLMLKAITHTLREEQHSATARSSSAT